MTLADRVLHDHAILDEAQADRLSQPRSDWNDIEVRPSGNERDHAATVNAFIRGVTEYQTRWLGLRNASPVIAYEIRRPTPDRIQLQYSTQLDRLERKIRTHLKGDLSGVEFREGNSGLPVSEGDSIGGGILTVGRHDWYPLATDHDVQPPINRVVESLHRHAVPETKVVLQVLFQPWIGQPLRYWYWTRRAYKRIGYLKREKEKLWGSRSPTKRERRQAQAIETKAGSPKYQVTIRILLISAGEHTSSRLKELGSGFNIFENNRTGQYLNTTTVRSLLQSRITAFATEVADRHLGPWSLPFHASENELAALVSVPDRTSQKNLPEAQP